MTGVSYMIPFVAAGGLLIALSFLLGGYEIVGPFERHRRQQLALRTCRTPMPLGLDHALFGSGFFAYIGAVFFVLGKTAFAFFIPALAGYIAYAIADRPGIAPGFVMGGLAADVMQFGTPQTGFLGAIVGGVLAGVIAHWIAGRKVPSWARGLMPVLVIPLFTTHHRRLPDARRLRQADRLADGRSSPTGLNNMSGANAVLLGVILGLMMAFDMGGPLNKVAYSFAAAGVGGAAALAADAPQLKIMAAVMLAGMVPADRAGPRDRRPPEAVHPRRAGERQGGLAARAPRSSPRARSRSRRPTRCASSRRSCSAARSPAASSMAFDVSVRAPHGGIFVLFAVGNILGYLDRARGRCPRRRRRR